MSLNDGREYHTAQTHYLYRDITYADNGETLSLGWVPPGASIIRGGVAVSTIFNGDSSNVFDLGYRNGGNSETDDVDEYASAQALTAATIAVGDNMGTTTVHYFPEGAEIVVGVTSTADASAGAARVWIEYLVPVDAG